MKEILPPSWNWTSNNNHWTGFLLWYLFDNAICVRTQTEEFTLEKGDTFIFDLSVNHICSHDPEHPASLFTTPFYCSPQKTLQDLLSLGKIPKKNHPQLYTMNMQLFEQAAHGTMSKEQVGIWMAPIFDQLFEDTDVIKMQPILIEICQLLDTHPEQHYTLEQLSAQAGYSPNQFIRMFKKYTGTTPYNYLIDSRIRRAKHLLLYDYSITQIAELLGYADVNHFSAQFHKKTGCYPSDYLPGK